jgi:hypothetical protein
MPVPVRTLSRCAMWIRFGILRDSDQQISEREGYKDFRQMLDQMGSQIDAVTVSTPDHMHAIVASAAMKMHKAVFCQKPLTQTIYEARYLRKMAEEKKIVTQMGNQGSAADGLRRAVETIQDGLIGQVHQVHVWTNRPVWPQGMDRPWEKDPIPDTLDWDKWIGPAPMRPYKSSAVIQRTSMECTTHLSGAAGRISAPARSATWRATRSICRSAP